MTKIYSQASCDCVFPIYDEPKEGSNVNKRLASEKIIISGGANVAKKRTNGETSKFTVTEVTPEQLKKLQDNPAFKRKVKSGFVSLSEPKEFLVDGSAQITEKEMAKKTKATVKTGESDSE